MISPEWLSRFNQFNKLWIGFSGGLDSTVLLHVLASHKTLVPKLNAVHVNHGISRNASSWETHCAQFCKNLGISFRARTVAFDRSANIEEGARIARYAVFSSLMAEQECLILGHHLNDQAETVLLQLVRGSGIDGLAAMNEWGQWAQGTLARPFLNQSREQLEHYAVMHQLKWIEDESNHDINYTRNYMRQEIIPLLQRKWPAIVDTLTRTAIHCQQAKRNLDALATHDVGEELLKKPVLDLHHIRQLSVDRIANIFRVWLKNNQIRCPSTETFQRLINELLFAREDANPEVNWGNTSIRRYQNALYLHQKNEAKQSLSREWSNFPRPLNQEGIHLQAKKASQGLAIPEGTQIEVRCRQGGEVFVWHGQTKRLKKLFQEWNVPPWLRERIPLIYLNNSLAAVVGYALSDSFFTKDSSHAWEIINILED